MNSESLFSSVIFFDVIAIFTGLITFLYGTNINDKSLIGIGISFIGAGAICLGIVLIVLFIYEYKVKK